MRLALFDSRHGRIPGNAPFTGRKQGIRISPATDRKKKVLVMDDDPVIGGVICLLLSGSEYDVRVTKNGAEAIEYFKKAGVLGNPFDAVILDLHVDSGMGGDKALEKLRDVDPKVKAILLTGDSRHPAVSGYEIFGFISALIKPFTSYELQQALDRACGTMSDGSGESPAA